MERHVLLCPREITSHAQVLRWSGQSMKKVKGWGWEGDDETKGRRNTISASQVESSSQNLCVPAPCESGSSLSRSSSDSPRWILFPTHLKSALRADIRFPVAPDPDSSTFSTLRSPFLDRLSRRRAQGKRKKIKSDLVLELPAGFRWKVQCFKCRLWP